MCECVHRGKCAHIVSACVCIEFLKKKSLLLIEKKEGSLIENSMFYSREILWYLSGGT